LVINTGTTIVTFLMVFLIQNTQTRDTTALQLKLDELIVATRGAHNAMAGIEEASDEELIEAKEEVRRRSVGDDVTQSGVNGPMPMARTDAPDSL
jgi:low affinity Fe/Cu permease